MAETSDILVVTTTVATPEDAKDLANLVLVERLAACVQMTQIHAYYHWQGEIVASEEVRLTFKSRPDLQGHLLSFLNTNHPYETPQILCRNEQASADYAAWVQSETTS